MRRIAVLFALVCLLAAPTVGLAQQFGGAVALTEDQILVGEARNQTLSGIVYVYQKEGDGWAPKGELKVTDELRSPDGFGRSLAFAHGVLAVGAPLVNDGAGAVYLFEPDGSGGWNQVARIDAPAGAPDGRFGSAVEWAFLSLAVSAPGNGGGSVHMYQPDQTGGWTPLPSLNAPSGVTGFGTRIAATPEGDHLLVAAPAGRGQPTDLYSYTRTGVDWQANGEFAPEGLPEGSGFGDAFAIAKGVAFVGAPGIDARAGRVFIYDLVNGSPTDAPAVTLGPTINESNARFGASIAIRDGEVWIGAPGTQGVGVTYAYSSDGGMLEVVRTLVQSGLEAGASMGGNVAPSRTLGVVAATGIDEGSGAALVFERATNGGWNQTATLTNPPRGFPAIAGDEVRCTEGQASIFDCQDVNITAFLPISALGGSRGTRVNDVWGWTDPESAIEYVIVGRTNGTAFVDISDPYNPVFVGDLAKTEGTRTTIWRDMKVYSNHVYIVADAAGEHGVQVFDLTRLREFDGEPITFDETFRYEGIHSAHNIVINEETGFAYAVGNSGGGETCGGGLHMINLENPSHPVFAGCFAEMGTGRRGTGYSHDAQCVVYRGPDEDHQGKEVCFGSNETALNIADVSDKTAPVSIATASYPSVAYAHQGWLTEDHTFFYMNDEGDEPQGLVEGTRTLVWDVTDLDDPILVKEHIAETTATDHNLYVKGDRMYQSNYSAGFRVLDVSDPADPVEIGFLDTSPYEGGASWSNYPFFESGVIAVTGTGDGLFLVRDMARRNLIP